MSIMTEDQIRVTLSKAKYWNEVIKRENTDILQEELLDEVRRLGVSILFILEDYSKRQIETISNEQQQGENRQSEIDKQ